MPELIGTLPNQITVWLPQTGEVADVRLKQSKRGFVLSTSGVNSFLGLAELSALANAYADGEKRIEVIDEDPAGNRCEVIISSDNATWITKAGDYLNGKTADDIRSEWDYLEPETDSDGETGRMVRRDTKVAAESRKPILLRSDPFVGEL